MTIVLPLQVAEDLGHGGVKLLEAPPQSVWKTGIPRSIPAEEHAVAPAFQPTSEFLRLVRILPLELLQPRSPLGGQQAFVERPPLALMQEALNVLREPGTVYRRQL